MDSTQLLWRPESYWKPGTKVKVNAPLTGVQTGSGKWIREDKGAEFTIADRARVIRVDLDDHFMRVVDNGKITAEYPISAGQARNTWETRSGTKVITEMHESYTMDAGTLGVPKDDPNYYSTDVTPCGSPTLGSSSTAPHGRWGPRGAVTSPTAASTCHLATPGSSSVAP